jgi:hypothetical protein
MRTSGLDTAKSNVDAVPADRAGGRRRHPAVGVLHRVRNLFLGLGVIIGLVVLRTGDAVAGEAIVLAFCAFMVLDGITLAVAGLLGYMPRRVDGLPGGLASSGPPLVALVAAAL